MKVPAFDEQYASKRGEAYLNIVDVHRAFVLVSTPPVALELVYPFVAHASSRAKVTHSRL